MLDNISMTMKEGMLVSWSTAIQTNIFINERMPDFQLMVILVIDESVNDHAGRLRSGLLQTLSVRHADTGAVLACPWVCQSAPEPPPATVH